MFGRETLRCPSCQGQDVRNSRWHSHEEKARHASYTPVRCTDCGHRFLVAAGQGPLSLALPIGLAAVAAVILLAVLVAAPWQTSETSPQTTAPPTINPVDMKAAEAGDVEAQFKVASAMLADSELEFAYSGKAIELLQRAAEKGHTRAMLRLGLLYRKGVGALQNFGLAAKWIENAARRGDPQAMLELGRLYREGVGVRSDPVQAYVWLNRAAAAHDPDAPFERKEVMRLLTTEQLHLAQEQSAFAEVPERPAPAGAAAPGP